MSWLALWLLTSAAWADDEPVDVVVVAQVAEARADWSPQRWIAEVDGQASKLAAVRYSARRTTERGEVTVEERWRYIADGSGRFRIDYFGDTARQVTCDGDVLVDYVPANGGAVRVDLHALSAPDLAGLMDGVLSRVSVPGVRIGQAQGVAWSFGASEVDGVQVIEGRGDRGSRLVYEIDADRLVILRSEIHQDGQIVLRTESTDHREIEPGAWFPHEVRMRAPDASGDVRVALHLTKVQPVVDPAARLFETKLDDSIPIEEMP